jgi:hypothetical protein
MTTCTAGRPALAAGQWLEGYQVQAQAPVSFIQGSRSRPIDGHLVPGAWSDPWWLFCPDRGWAVAKRWRNKERQAVDWSRGWEHSRRVTIAARDEVIVEPWAAE